MKNATRLLHCIYCVSKFRENFLSQKLVSNLCCFLKLLVQPLAGREGSNQAAIDRSM
jgi:hypothetical protein